MLDDLAIVQLVVFIIIVHRTFIYFTAHLHAPCAMGFTITFVYKPPLTEHGKSQKILPSSCEPYTTLLKKEEQEHFNLICPLITRVVLSF